MTSLPSLPSLPPEIIQELAVHGAPFTLYGRTSSEADTRLLKEYLSRVFPTWRVDPFQTAAYLAQRNPDLLVSYLLLTGKVDRYGILASPAVFRGDLALLNRLLGRTRHDLLYFQLLTLAAAPPALSVFRGLVERISTYLRAHPTIVGLADSRYVSLVRNLVDHDNFEGLVALARADPLLFRGAAWGYSFTDIRPRTLQRLIPLLPVDVAARLVPYDSLLDYRIAAAAGLALPYDARFPPAIRLWKALHHARMPPLGKVFAEPLLSIMERFQRDRSAGRLPPAEELAATYSWEIAALYLLDVNPTYLVASSTLAAFAVHDPDQQVLECLIYGGYPGLLDYLDQPAPPRYYDEFVTSIARINRPLLGRVIQRRPPLSVYAYARISRELVDTADYDDVELLLASYPDTILSGAHFNWTGAGLARFLGRVDQVIIQDAGRAAGISGDLDLLRVAVEAGQAVEARVLPLIGWELYWLDLSYSELVSLRVLVPRGELKSALVAWLDRLIAVKQPPPGITKP